MHQSVGTTRWRSEVGSKGSVAPSVSFSRRKAGWLMSLEALSFAPERRHDVLEGVWLGREVVNLLGSLTVPSPISPSDSFQPYAGSLMFLKVLHRALAIPQRHSPLRGAEGSTFSVYCNTV